MGLIRAISSADAGLPGNPLVFAERPRELRPPFPPSPRYPLPTPPIYSITGLSRAQSGAESFGLMGVERLRRALEKAGKDLLRLL